MRAAFVLLVVPSMLVAQAQLHRQACVPPRWCTSSWRSDTTSVVTQSSLMQGRDRECMDKLGVALMPVVTTFLGGVGGWMWARAVDFLVEFATWEEHESKCGIHVGAGIGLAVGLLVVAKSEKCPERLRQR